MDKLYPEFRFERFVVCFENQAAHVAAIEVIIIELIKEALLWWQENRPIKDDPHVFLCLENKKFCQESYGKPFQYRQYFMGNLCEREKVKPFGFHSIRHLTASTLYKLGFVIADIQSVLRHQSATTTARHIKSLGLEGVRSALEALSQQKGNVLIFKPREIIVGENPSEKEKPSQEPSTSEMAFL
jgi:hypothetical protein